MRLSEEIIKEEGERISPHSKFYIWDDKLFEPVYYAGKKCKTYKVITDISRINRIMDKKKQLESIPTVSSVCGNKLKRKVIQSEASDRFEILDL